MGCWFTHQGSNPRPLYWKCRVSATRPPGKSLIVSFFIYSNNTAVTILCCVKAPAFLSVRFSSVAQSCPRLCNPMNRSTPGLPVHHQLQEFTQTHGHRVSDAIQPSHPLSSPSPPAPKPSQHQSFPMSTLRMRWPKYWGFSFSIIPSKEIPGLISLKSKGLSRVFPNTTVQKHQFFSAQLSSQSNSHIHT